MINLNEKYNQDDFLNFLKDFLPDFEKDVRQVGSTGLQVIKKATYLGNSNQLDLGIFELSHSGSQDKRVALATDGFRILKQSATFQALVIFYSPDTDEWRLSLMTATPERNERGGVIVRLSNPKRYSFALGERAKTNTPYNFLIRKGKLTDFEDLKSRFSVEVVNKEFYKEIANLYTKLVGGVRGEGRSRQEYPGIIKLPSVPKESRENQEFAVRLIGRIIFCWFLREKRSETGLSLISNKLLSLDAAKESRDYYHSILEPLFFEVLNKTLNTRKDKYQQEPFNQIPYLNGGLFSPQQDDYYSPDDEKQTVYHNTLVIPDEWLHEFLEVLERYNFTVDENTSVDIDLSIDPEMLGRIFENLLAEINPETGESARKSTGSYYTPRTIVEYMVDESLYQYLKVKTEIEEPKLRALISYDLSDDEESPLSNAEKVKIIEALSGVTILDPACGSGAFPIGALQKIVFMLQKLDPNGQLWFQRQLEGAPPEIRRVIEREFTHRNFDYIRKLGVIREGIFGVDIQPVATEIARLRCFLTLIVEERVADEEPNRGIEPLPNLDFKFVTANSLIGLPTSQQHGQVELFEDQEGIDQLKEVRDEYFNASGPDRENLKTKFVQIQNKMFQKMITHHYQADLTRKLSAWDPFGHEAADWFDSDWMFGVSEGFDIIIANPPYLGNKGHKDLFQKIKSSSLGVFYQRRVDLFYFFFHLAINLSKEYGTVAFISTNYYPTATGARNLRTDFKNRTSILKLIDFNELKIFESAKGQHNMVTVFQKNNNSNSKVLTTLTHRKGSSVSDTLEHILEGVDNQTEYNSLSQGDLYDGEENYIRLMGTNGSTSRNPTLSVLNKISVQGTRLDQHFNIYKGITTGLDRIFVFNTNQLIDLNLTPKELTFFRDWFKNSDIHQFFTSTKAKKKVLYLTKEDTSIEHLPNIKSYLTKHINEIKNRKDANLKGNFAKGFWWVLATPRVEIPFDKEKIVVPQRSVKNTFGYNICDWYASGDVYYIIQKTNTLSIRYALAILNSKLYYIWLYYRGKRKGETLELYQKPLSEIPIKKISDADQKPFIEIVDKILAITKSSDYLENPAKKEEVKEYEKQIDQLVYKLYDLTPEEIAIIEKPN